MVQGLLPRLAHLPHRYCPRGPLWRRMEDTIAPLPVLNPVAPLGPMPLPMGWPFPEKAAGCKAQGAFQGGGAVDVTALCSKTMEVRHENFFASAEPARNMGARGRCGSRHLRGADYEPCRKRRTGEKRLRSAGRQGDRQNDRTRDADDRLADHLSAEAQSSGRSIH